MGEWDTESEGEKRKRREVGWGGSEWMRGVGGREGGSEGGKRDEAWRKSQNGLSRSDPRRKYRKIYNGQETSTEIYGEGRK